MESWELPEYGGASLVVGLGDGSLGPVPEKVANRQTTQTAVLSTRLGGSGSNTSAVLPTCLGSNGTDADHFSFLFLFWFLLFLFLFIRNRVQ